MNSTEVWEMILNATTNSYTYDSMDCLTSKAVTLTTTTTTPDCFADLGNVEEEFYIKSYNTSSMYNLMYEDTSLGTFTMLRHWIEAGNQLNKYLQEFNYVALDPTGLALGEHFGTSTLFGNYACTTDMLEAITTQSVQDSFGVFSSITGPEGELKGWNDHRPLGGEYTDNASGFTSVSHFCRCGVGGLQTEELDPTAKTLDILASECSITNLSGSMGIIREREPEWRFFPFRFRFHVEFDLVIETKTLKEKYIPIPGPNGTSIEGSEQGWRNYLNARSIDGKNCNINVLRASYGAYKTTGGACDSYACSFVLNYQSLMANQSIAITPFERHTFHVGRCHVDGRRGRVVTDLDYLYDLDHQYGNGVSSSNNSGGGVDPTTGEFQDYYGAIAEFISDGSPLDLSAQRYFPFGPYYGMHAEICIGHRYEETEIIKYHIEIDSETGFSCSEIGRTYEVTYYCPITIQNTNNSVVFRWHHEAYNKDGSGDGYYRCQWNPLLSEESEHVGFTYLGLP